MTAKVWTIYKFASKLTWIRSARYGVIVPALGKSVLASRKPSMYRTSVDLQKRSAARRFPGSTYQPPLRRTRRLQSPVIQAVPSAGAPL
jgi:hypothetical protein